MPVPSPRSKLLPARGNAADLLANVTALVEGEICYAVDENAYYQKVGASLVKVSGGSGGDSYDDTALASRVTTAEGDIDALETTVANIQASGYDDTALSARVTTAEGEIDTLETTVAGLSNYDDTALAGRVTTAEGDIDALETTVASLSNYDDTALEARVATNEGDISTLETTVAGLSNYDDTALAGRMTTAEGDIDALEITVAGLSSYDDTALAARVTTAEGDISTLQTDFANITHYDDTALAARVTTAEGEIDTLQTDVAGKLADAPSDGSQYARKDGAWEVVAASGGGDEAVVSGHETLTGYRWETKVDLTGLDLLNGTDLQPGEWGIAVGTPSNLYMNPVDASGVDRTAEITADFTATGAIFVGLDNVYGPWTSMTQTDGAFAQGSNGYITFQIDNGGEASTIDGATDSIHLAIQDNPPAALSVPASDGEILKAVNGKFRPAADTIASKSDVSVSNLQNGEALIWNGSEFANGSVSSSSSITTADDFAQSVEPAVSAPFVNFYECAISQEVFEGYDWSFDALLPGQFAFNWNSNTVADPMFYFNDEDSNGNKLSDTFAALLADQGTPADNAITVQFEIGMPRFGRTLLSFELDQAPGYDIVDGIVRIYGASLQPFSDHVFGSNIEHAEAPTYVRFAGVATAGGTRALTEGDVVAYDGANFVNQKNRAPKTLGRGISNEELLAEMSYLEFTTFTGTGAQADGTFTRNLDFTALSGAWSMEAYAPQSGGTSDFTAFSYVDANGVNTREWMMKWLLEYQGMPSGIQGEPMRDCEVQVVIDGTFMGKVRLYDTKDDGTYPAFQKVDDYGDDELYGPHTFQMREGVAVASEQLKVMLQDYMFAASIASNDPADIVTPTSIKFYPVPVNTPVADRGTVMAFDPAVNAYVGQQALTISKLGPNNIDTEYDERLIPQDQDTPGYVGEIRIDVYNSEMYMYVGPYNSYDSSGGWVKWTFNTLPAGNGGGYAA